MKKKIKQPAGVPSPCISVCAMDEETGYCRGCFRTLEEIAKWERYDDTRRRQVLDALPLRRPSYQSS